MKKLLISLLMTLCLVAYGDKTPELHVIQGKAQGTTYTMKFWQADGNIDSNAMQQAVDAEIARIDRLISNYRKDSTIEQFNQNPSNDAYAIDKEITDLLSVAKTVHQKSQGCYDPTVSPIFKLWGFKRDKFHHATEAEVAEVLTKVGFDDIDIADGLITRTGHKGMTLSTSAIGQGYAIQQIADLFKHRGINNYLIEIGGEMQVLGKKPDDKHWRVAIESPKGSAFPVQEFISFTGDTPVSLMTSGTYKHFFDNNGKRFSHILSPQTGKPIEHDTVLASVLIEDATFADAWSTALLCLGAEKGLAVANAENIPAYFVTADKDNNLSVKRSKALSPSKHWTLK